MFCVLFVFFGEVVVVVVFVGGLMCDFNLMLWCGCVVGGIDVWWGFSVYDCFVDLVLFYVV